MIYAPRGGAAIRNRMLSANLTRIAHQVPQERDLNLGEVFMRMNTDTKEEYLAHISEDGIRVQTVQAHLNNVAELAGQFADAFHRKQWGYCCGMLHDIGKYSREFQERIRGSEIRVDHSTAGAKICQEKNGWYSLLGYCIAGHHGGIPDKGTSADADDNKSLSGRIKKQLKDFRAYEREIKIPELSDPPLVSSADKSKVWWDAMFFLRMVFSCLVDADYLDTERFMRPDQYQIRSAGAAMEQLSRKLELHIEGWLANREHDTVNGRRTEILKACLEKGEKRKGLYRLTVPTGGGKTIASLAFALRHAVYHQLDRIIYVIPYTSIIEQNAKIFSDILGPENVLENHCNVDYGDDEELKPMHLAAENWDKPIVVTTNVQFFESIFSNKPSKCRKLHNIANSVIIFDEAQMLPNDYLKPCVKAIEQLTELYECSAVLCTATQPSLKSIFSEGIKSIELCPDMEEQFRFFKRTSFKNEGMISETCLIERLKKETQALCILNTKKLAQTIYKQLDGEGIYHLSAFMYPAHRKRVLDTIRKRLKDGKKCILISTSLVEAGVDLDFQSVYRQINGIDSVIQAAGRCNREGRRPVDESFVYIFQLEGQKSPQGQQQQIATAKHVLQNHQNADSLEAIAEYFELLYHYKGEALDKKHVLEKISKGTLPFSQIGKEFKLIEQETQTILIAAEEQSLKLQYEILQRGMTKALMREAGKYSINIYQNEFETLNAFGLLKPLSADQGDNFHVLKDEGIYTEDMGLEIRGELGDACFF